MISQELCFSVFPLLISLPLTFFSSSGSLCSIYSSLSQKTDPGFSAAFRLLCWKNLVWKVFSLLGGKWKASPIFELWLGTFWVLPPGPWKIDVLQRWGWCLCSLCGLNSRRFWSRSSGGCQPEIKGLALRGSEGGSVSGSLLGSLMMAIFFLCLFTSSSTYAGLCVPISSYKDTSHAGLGPTPRPLFWPDYLFENLISK